MFLKTYQVYTGCYLSSNTDDVFNENLTPAQCNASAIAPDYCDQNNGYNEIYSNSSMTVEKCVQICITTYGYKYAGINQA
jgi:hypothetical protein